VPSNESNERQRARGRGLAGETIQFPAVGGASSMKPSARSAGKWSDHGLPPRSLFGRGGDQSLGPSSSRGFARRFTETNENYDHQHHYVMDGKRRAIWRLPEFDDFQLHLATWRALTPLHWQCSRSAPASTKERAL